MNICFAMCGMEFGGAERVVSILANELVLRGSRVSICILSNDEPKISYDLNEEIEIKKIRTFGYARTLIDNTVERKLINYLKKNNVNVVLTFSTGVGYIVAPICKKYNIPYIHSERNDPKRVIKGIGMHLKWKRLSHNVDYVVFQTHGAMKLYPKRIQDKATILLNPFNTNNLPPYFEKERSKELVNVGRLSPQKRQDVLINVFAKLADKYPDYSLKIYGSGELESKLKTLILDKGLQDRVFLMGTRNNILEAINNAALFAFSSDYEGLPNALIEAMALGLPCVSTKCSPGGAEELICDGVNGRLVECGDVDALATVIDEMLENNEQSLQMGMEARKIVYRLDTKNIVDEWEKYIQRVIKTN